MLLYLPLDLQRLAEGVVVLVVQMGEEEEKTGVVPRAEESTVVQWAGAGNKSMAGAVQGLEPKLRPCFPSFLQSSLSSSFDSNWRACAQFQLSSFAHACV